MLFRVSSALLSFLAPIAVVRKKGRPIAEDQRKESFDGKAPTPSSKHPSKSPGLIEKIRAYATNVALQKQVKDSKGIIIDEESGSE